MKSELQLKEETIKELNTALMDACKENDISKVIDLIKKGANVNYIGFNSGLTFLHWASCKGNLDLIKILIKEGAELNPTGLPAVVFKIMMDGHHCIML